MPRINVYLPEELAARARAADLNVSALTQQAVRTALESASVDTWLASLRTIPAAHVPHDVALQALDDIREEPPTHHG